MSNVVVRPSLRASAVSSIAVFRALQLGDMLCVVPAFRALRQAFPTAHITLIGLPWAAAFVERFRRHIDDFVAFPGHPGLPEREPDIDALPGFFRDMRERRFDLAIQLHGSGPIVNAIVERFVPRVVAGFTLSPDDHRPGGLFMPWPTTGHEIHRFLSLIEYLGLPTAGDRLEFPLTVADRKERADILARHSLEEGRYVCVHPGARLRSRRWPTERFARVADAVARLGHRIALTGSSEETALTADVRSRMSAPAVDLAGQSSLGGMAALIAGARLLVSNDTGVSHIAAGVGTPSVIVTMGSDPGRWAPLDADRHRVVYEPIDCRPCAYELCPIGHPCALAVDAGKVTEVVRRQISWRSECVPCES